MIWNILAIPALRYLFKIGLAPKGVFIRRALKALRQDDIKLAIDTYFELAKKNYNAKKVQILREILISELKYRKKILLDRIDDIHENICDSNSLEEQVRVETQRELKGINKAINILDNYLKRMGIGMRDLNNVR